MDPKPKRQPVPAGGQPTPDTIAAADATPAATTDAASADAAPADATSAGATPADAGTAEASTDHPPADDSGPVEARVLVAFDDHDANHVITASAAEIERLKLAGHVDPHPDAVAYAKSLIDEA